MTRASAAWKAASSFAWRMDLSPARATWGSLVLFGFMILLAKFGMMRYNQAMERNEISLHETKVFLSLDSTWKSNRDIAKQAGVAERTARLHTKRFADLGICDLAEVFPSHRFRLSDKGSKRNKGYWDRLNRAVEVFGDQAK